MDLIQQIHSDSDSSDVSDDEKKRKDPGVQPKTSSSSESPTQGASTSEARKRSASDSKAKMSSPDSTKNPSPQQCTKKRSKTQGTVEIVSSSDAPQDAFVRTVPHRRGHWAGHVKVNVPATKYWKTQKQRSTQQFQSLLQNQGYSGMLMQHETIHMSVSKPFSLQVSQIESFVKHLSMLLQEEYSTNLHVDIDHPIILTNDEETRSFWCWKVHSTSTLLRIVAHVDAVLAKYSQPPYYTPPTFHVSIASFPGKVDMDTGTSCDDDDDDDDGSSSENAASSSEEEDDEDDSSEDESTNTLDVTQLQCNFGTTQEFLLPLKKKR